MQPKQKVIREKKELDEKVEKLIDFMHSEDYPTLSAVKQGLLMVRLVAMQNYSDALNRSIEIAD